MPTKLIDIGKVLAVNLGAISFSLADIQVSLSSITVEDIQAYLSISSLILAISYTVWKWLRDFRKKK